MLYLTTIPVKDFVNFDLNPQPKPSIRDFDVRSIDTVRFQNVFQRSGSQILSLLRQNFHQASVIK